MLGPGGYCDGRGCSVAAEGTGVDWGELMIRNSQLYLYTCACLALGGCLGEPGADEPAVDTADQELAQPSDHHFTKGFGGNITSQTFRFTSEEGLPSGACTPGYRRPAAPRVNWYSNAGGHCTFLNWQVESDVHNCRPYIEAVTGGGFFGGTCETFVDEVPDAPDGQFPYERSNTASAQVNTVDMFISVPANATLSVGTCGVIGASFHGDTYLRLFNPFGQEVAASDDISGCGLGSAILCTHPPARG